MPDTKGSPASAGYFDLFTLPEDEDIELPPPSTKKSSKLPNVGRKNDSEKPRWSLVPFKGMLPVVLVLMYGAQKYGDNNWLKVDNYEERYLNAAMRHLAARFSGETVDPESGLPHTAHAICSLLFLLERKGS